MKKRILSIALAVVLLLSCIPMIVIPVSASSALSFSEITFTGYKGWLDADAGGQDRYNQRGYDLGLQKGTLSNIMSGNAAEAQSNNVGEYYPELYLNVSGQLVRDNTYDEVNTDVNLETYLASGLGKYYGVYKFRFSSYVALDTFTVYNQAAWWHLNRGFDILVSADGTTWTKVATYTNMGNYDNWDSSTTTSFGGKDCLLRTTDMGGVRALYVAVAVTDPAGGGPNCALWYATATGTAATSVSVSSVTYKSYQSYLSGTYSNRRSWDRFTLTEGNKAIVNCETDKGGTVAYKAYSYPTKDYFPAVYLNGEGQLVRDSRYDNNGSDVNLADYLAEGVGKYYGVYIIKFANPVLLDSFVVYNNTSWYHLSQAFDVLYSADGNIWTKKASYTGMGDWGKWDSSSTTTVDGASCLKKTTDMGGVNAWYVAVAITSPAGQDDHRCCLWYTESTGRATTEVYASDTTSLTNAVTYANSNPGTTIKITKDMTCTGSVGTISGADTILDGQDHTIYNLTGTFANINAAGVTVKNLTFSDKTSSGGSSMGLTGVKSLFGWIIQGGTLSKPVVIENITNQRNTSGVSDLCGLFAQSAAGYVTFRNCVNEGNITASSGGNYKVSGFVGGLQTAGSVTTFDSCTNTGNVSGSQAGGFVGMYKGDVGLTINMTNCSNSGTITAIVNGSARGLAGGLIGSLNNAGDVTANTYITLTGCTNNGDILLDSTAENSEANAIGGLIGYAGNVPDNSTVTCAITIDNCGVYNCSIDAIDTDNAHGSYYAAGFIGKISPHNDANVDVTVKNSYLSKVNVSAGNARKFVGVGTYSVNVVTAENCMVYKLAEVNSADEEITWNASAMTGCARIFSADNVSKTGFADTDTENIISGGGASFVQTNGENPTTRIRFVATLPTGFNLSAYERVGFYVVALTSANTDGQTNKVWIRNTQNVYTSIRAGGSSQTANEIRPGAQYLYLCEIDSISENIGTVDFYLTPYVICADGRILYGQTGTYTITNGTDSTEPITLLSYNLKDGDYNGDSAQDRKSSLANVVKGQDADIVCLQELGSSKDSYHFTLSNDFASRCNNKSYAYQQAGRTGIMWDSTIYTKVSNGSVDCTISAGDGGDGYSRVCTWVQLQRTADGETFYVVSAHFDLNKPNDCATILNDYISANFGSSRVIVAGDFNADETRKSVREKFFYAGFTNANAAFNTVLANNANLQDDWNHGVDGYPAAYGLNATFPSAETIIDWCYYNTNGFIWNSFSVVTGAGTTPSDHYPIYASLTLRR